MFDLDWYRRVKKILNSLTTPSTIHWMSEHERHFFNHENKPKKSFHAVLDGFACLSTMQPENVELYNYVVRDYMPYFGIKMADYNVPKIRNSYSCL
jgi:hypothetical protein